MKPSESEKITFWKPYVNLTMEADEDRPEAVEATTVVPGTDSAVISSEEEIVRRRNKWNGMKLAAEAEGDVDEDDDPEEDEVRSFDVAQLPLESLSKNVRAEGRFPSLR